MNYLFSVNEERLIPLPDKICNELAIQVGDILICESAKNSSEIVLRKNAEQTLTDDEIAIAGNLTRVIPVEPE